ncbi:vitamin K epoxide reductase family protein [Flavobacterium sp.]|uniref:vitamin K epoxide reductase family protein n=1 Tax=Flavobacterium sp. TaxID=239 RepID=UPI00262C09C1|nr:vitamin K epoxide reductase family protein [Flavobacterium sp.]
MLKLVQKNISLIGYSSLRNEFEELFLSHPNYPSLFAVTDSLDSLAIENIAARIDKSQLSELPNVFLAFVNIEDGKELVLVKKSNDKTIFETEKGIKSNLSIDDFVAIWDGIIVAIEPNVVEKTTNTKSNNYLWLILFGLSIFGVFVFRNGFNGNQLFFFFSSIIGLIIGFFIIQEKFGVPNEIASKICNGLKSTCDSVIKSKSSEINSWLSFSDFPILFFGINIVAIFLSVSSINYIGIVSVLSIPFLGYSIWLQKQKLKKWCALCLITGSIIFLQSIVFLLSNNFQISNNDNFYYFFSLVFISAIWFYIKPIFEKKIKSEKQVSELIRFKRNIKLFEFLSKDINSIQLFDTLHGIDIGNQEANIQLNLILSPSCGHCHKAFQDAISLLEKYPEKMKLQILFNLNPDNSDNPYQLVVQNLFAINYYRNQEVLEAISDWHIENLSLEIWLKKWGGNGITTDVEKQIQLQYNWCLENNFNYTPVKIINDKLFPDGYEISELRYFLNDFNEQTKEKNIEMVEAI